MLFNYQLLIFQCTRNYLDTIGFEGNLVGGFCIKSDILTNKSEREYFLNVLSGLNCDMYWIYVDCINQDSNFAQLYNYSTALIDLQKSTNKPVIAGRIGSFGLVLLAFGLYAFESGTSRFESFSEDLYKDATDPFNMYIRYYFPELMANIAVERKNPVRIIQLLNTKIGENIACQCPYCKGVDPSLLVVDKLTRKHFLYRRQEEIQILRSISSVDKRVEYIRDRITKAIDYYKNLKPIFKDDDYKYLKTWIEVIDKLRERG